MQQENKEEKCKRHNFIEVGGKCTECGESSITQTFAPQTPDSWIEEFDEKFIIPKGHFQQKGWDRVEGHHIWGKFAQDGGKEIKDFIRTQITLAHSSGRREGIEESIKKVKNANTEPYMEPSEVRFLIEEDLLSLLDKDLT